MAFAAADDSHMPMFAVESGLANHLTSLARLMALPDTRENGETPRPADSLCGGSRQFPSPDRAFIGVMIESDDIHPQFFKYPSRRIVFRQCVRTYDPHPDVTKSETG